MSSKKRQANTDEPPDLIQIMVVSLFIILLAFFILLNSIAVFDEKRILAVMESLIGSFGVMTGGESNLEGKGGDMSLPDMEHLSSHVDFSDLMVGADDIINLIHIKTDYRGTMMSIPAHLFFERGGLTITPQGERLLLQISRTIRKNPYPVDIASHTDNRPAGDVDTMSNRELSTLRSIEVMKVLLTKGGVAADRLTAYGWGASRPVVANTTRETRKMNRRIELVFIHEASPEKPKGIFTFKKFFFNVFE